MADTIQVRRGSTSAWNSANPVLALGEQGYDTTARQTKVGDGTTAWTSLPYVNVPDFRVLCIRPRRRYNSIRSKIIL